MNKAGIVAAVPLALAVGHWAIVSGQSASSSPSQADVARLEGAWVRVDTAGSGSFDGLGRSIPTAELKPDAAAGAGGRGGGRAGAGGRGGGGAGARGGGRGAPVETTPHE